MKYDVTKHTERSLCLCEKFNKLMKAMSIRFGTSQGHVINLTNHYDIISHYYVRSVGI